MHLPDHHLITADLPLLPEVMPLRHGRHLKKADWKEFSGLVTSTFQEYEPPIFWSANQIDKSTSFLHKAINNALDKVAPNKPY
jgi:hypothetical protein